MPRTTRSLNAAPCRGPMNPSYGPQLARFLLQYEATPRLGIPGTVEFAVPPGGPFQVRTVVPLATTRLRLVVNHGQEPPPA